MKCSATITKVMKIKGGSQHLTDAIYEKKVKKDVVLKHQLVGLSKNKTAGYDLLFGSDGETKKVHADYVVLAIPFTVLRGIKNGRIDMPAERENVLMKLAMATVAKFVMGMNSKPWRSAGKQGYTFSDFSFGCGWDSSQSQSKEEGSFTVFAGGKFGDGIYEKQKEELIADFIPDWLKYILVLRVAYNNKNIKYCWEKNPHIRGGYSSFKKGQWSTLAGWEAQPIEKLFIRRRTCEQ